MEYKVSVMLKKTGKSLASMSPDEKKKFFNSVDAAHSAKSELHYEEYLRQVWCDAKDK